MLYSMWVGANDLAVYDKKLFVWDHSVICVFGLNMSPKKDSGYTCPSRLFIGITWLVFRPIAKRYRAIGRLMLSMSLSRFEQ